LCGIIGIIDLSGDVSERLFKGLKLLEYRGYDSAGMAVIDDNRLHVVKDRGRIDEIHEKYDFLTLKGNIGIAHTRWATHGAPDKVNAHPHIDCIGSIAVVHNGIIENFMDLKTELMEQGHRFRSRTDTEVIAHLLEEYLKNEVDVETAFVKTLRKLDGAYALAVLTVKEPQKIFCARVDSPLVLGVEGEKVYCSSDIPSLLPFTNKIVPLEDGEYAVLTPGNIMIKRISDGSPVRRAFKELDMGIDEAKKDGYPHYMLKEIYEQPYSIRYALGIQRNYLELMADFIDRSSRLYIVAAGTSYHAGVVGSYIFSRLARIPGLPVIASEFVSRYGDSISVEDSILAISQSGETRDVLWAVEQAKIRGATILAIVNVLASTLTRISRIYLHQQSGPEIGVAATKTYTGQLAVLYKIGFTLARKRGKLGQDEMDRFVDELNKVPEVVEILLKRCDHDMRKLANEIKDSKYVIFLGRGVNTATAYEGRLKLMEISYIPSLAYPAGENKHGPISLIERGIPVIGLVQDDETKKLMISNLHEVRSRGAKTYVISSIDDNDIREVSDVLIKVPQVSAIFTPIVYAIPLQLLAYYTSVLRGLDPDKPRNLAKSVTVI